MRREQGTSSWCNDKNLLMCRLMNVRDRISFIVGRLDGSLLSISLQIPVKPALYLLEKKRGEKRR